MTVPSLIASRFDAQRAIALANETFDIEGLAVGLIRNTLLM